MQYNLFIADKLFFRIFISTQELNELNWQLYYQRNKFNIWIY